MIKKIEYLEELFKVLNTLKKLFKNEKYKIIYQNKKFILKNVAKFNGLLLLFILIIYFFILIF